MRNVLRRAYRLVMIFITAAIVLVMVGCEADPHTSTYQREKNAEDIVNLTDEYSDKEYDEMIFSDQPSTSDECDIIGLKARNYSAVAIPAELREDLREKIEGFAHAWMQHGYTYSTEEDYEKASIYLTPRFSEAFSSEIVSPMEKEVEEEHVMMDISSISYYDEYCRKYVADGDKEIIRIKAEITVRRSGDEEYFIKHSNVNRGDTSHELYFYFEGTGQMLICAVYETTHVKSGNYKCWYTGEGIMEDTSEMMVDEFSSITANEYAFVKNEVSVLTIDKNVIYHRIDGFITSFFDGSKEISELITDQEVDSEVLEPYVELKNAIIDKEVVQDKNYVSFSLEMAFPDIRLYERNQENYYVVKESVMLDSYGNLASKEGLDFIETGLWKYSIYFVFRADDRDYHIIRVEIKADSGPYESVGDLDEG